MSYFDPTIFNKENLRKSDLMELEYWNEVFKDTIFQTKVDEEYKDAGSETFEKMRAEIISDFCDKLREHLAYTMQEHLVSRINNYEDEVSGRREYTTFLDDLEDEKDE